METLNKKPTRLEAAKEHLDMATGKTNSLRTSGTELQEEKGRIREQYLEKNKNKRNVLEFSTNYLSPETKAILSIVTSPFRYILNSIVNDIDYFNKSQENLAKIRENVLKSREQNNKQTFAQTELTLAQNNQAKLDLKTLQRSLKTAQTPKEKIDIRENINKKQLEINSNNRKLYNERRQVYASNRNFGIFSKGGVLEFKPARLFFGAIARHTPAYVALAFVYRAYDIVSFGKNSLAGSFTSTINNINLKINNISKNYETATSSLQEISKRISERKNTIANSNVVRETGEDKQQRLKYAQHNVNTHTNLKNQRKELSKDNSDLYKARRETKADHRSFGIFSKGGMLENKFIATPLWAIVKFTPAYYVLAATYFITDRLSYGARAATLTATNIANDASQIYAETKLRYIEKEKYDEDGKERKRSGTVDLPDDDKEPETTGLHAGKPKGKRTHKDELNQKGPENKVLRSEVIGNEADDRSKGTGVGGNQGSVSNFV